MAWPSHLRATDVRPSGGPIVGFQPHIKHLRERLLAARADQPDAQGRLPLHVAAWEGAPLDVIRQLHAEYPAAAWTSEPGSSWLPLHIALQANASPDVALALLEVHVPAASCTASNGWLALHIAARRGAADSVLAALLRANPAALRALSDVGDTPLALARKHGQHGAVQVLAEAEWRAEDERQQRARRATKLWWEASDEAQRRELSQRVSEDQKRLAQRLASADGVGEGMGAAGGDAEMFERELSALRQTVDKERGEREQLQEALKQEQAERERLQSELDQANASPAPKKEPSGDVGDWKRCTSKKNGAPFWYNKKTKKSTWSDPAQG